ncbi:hypothetical protein LshimejAT787_0102950 [Lyophyllum shimeji]|uniref:Uncharacterized protein n=1 Tax=Lyophyllum shimeji TaxID=47721 RepID=A0A9P3PCM9_LYOSH|nr:hypothetical protein LshimejAT787_0102950 [Lyophyllum shimeji]
MNPATSTEAASQPVFQDHEKQIAKEGEAEDSVHLQHALKNAAEHEQSKARKALRQAESIVSKSRDEETAATEAISKATHGHGIAIAFLRGTENDAEDRQNQAPVAKMPELPGSGVSVQAVETAIRHGSATENPSIVVEADAALPTVLGTREQVAYAADVVYQIEAVACASEQIATGAVTGEPLTDEAACSAEGFLASHGRSGGEQHIVVGENRHMRTGAKILTSVITCGVVKDEREVAEAEDVRLSLSGLKTPS